jgi:RNA recognition motif-containing protein
VGNLPYSFRDEDLQQTFSQYGSVQRQGHDGARHRPLQGFRLCRNGQRC